MTASKNSSKMFGYAYYTEEEIDLENMTSQYRLIISKLKQLHKQEVVGTVNSARLSFLHRACDFRTEVVYLLSIPNTEHQPKNEAENQGVRILQSSKAVHGACKGDR